MEIIWSRNAKKQLLNIDCRYREKIKQKLHDIGDVMAPPPDLKSCQGQKTITDYAWEITALPSRTMRIAIAAPLSQ